MLVTIGILAHNEESTIEPTLSSLLGQSAFRAAPPAGGDNYDYHVMVVPNGCSDDTAGAASRGWRAALARSADIREPAFSVRSLTRGGKSNAWNELIHSLSDPATDIFLLIDADIEFGHVDTIINSLNCLIASPHVRAVVDRPLKDFMRKRRLSVIEAFSARMSRASNDAKPAIAGSFYCARASTLRDIWMPLDVSVEDGFLYAMIVTDCFRAPEDASVVVRAPDASHYFEGITRVGDYIRHEVRMVIGTALNCYLCWDTLLFLTAPSSAGAGALIRDLNAAHPDWYRRLMTNTIAKRGRWVLLSGLFWRFANLRKMPWSRRLRRWPLVALAFPLDLWVLWLANRKLRSGGAIGFW